MKTKSILQVTTALLLSAFSLQPSALFAQGPLAPPGAPVPTMKTLDQIEARTPISSAPFTISTGGSYYLTTNVTVSSGDAITIAADNVTLDLNGFTIASTRPAATTDSAILLSGGRMNVAIYNGHISSGVTNTGAGVFGGGGFGNGINSSYPLNVRVKDVSVAGVLNDGILLNAGNFDSTVVESCTVILAGGYGIIAESVSDSTAINCGLVAIVADTAHNCKGIGVGNGAGLYVLGTANNCYGSSSGNGGGVYVLNGTAQNCYGKSSGVGAGLESENVATGCYGYSYGGTGLSAINAQNCYGQSDHGSYGLKATTANNCIGYCNGGGSGLAATAAQNCSGSSNSGTGLVAYHIATGCDGSSFSGKGLDAYIGNSCYGSGPTNYTVAHPYNMP